MPNSSIGIKFMIKNIFFASFFLLLILSFPADADTIILKNGKKIETMVAWEDGEQIKCRMFGSVIGFSKENVERVEKTSLGEKREMMQIASGSKHLPLPKKQQSDTREQISVRKNSDDSLNVIKVFDGDTFMAKYSGIKIKVRLIGIDAPETASKRKGMFAQPYSRKSKEFLENAVTGNPVQIRSYGTDHYNRQLAEVFFGDRNINLELVGAGLAEVYQGKMEKGFDVNPYRQAETKARSSRTGMWSLGDRYISPKKWRKMHRK
ncbi:MAG: hypothetical protein B6245_07735 [Desulfobacteraceae bacterium 4572_88]|nr:MAG: hypothetical protein B6245_07735 [Desulfobacteraceae bacterium 4572_88]